MKKDKDSVSVESSNTGEYAAFLTLSVEGARLAVAIREKAKETGDTLLAGAVLYVHNNVPQESAWGNAHRFDATKDVLAEIFPTMKNIICIMPTGVVVRAIAPLVDHKLKDPAVVVMDVIGRWAISLLSGHEGGANALCVRLSNLCAAEPIITTTTDAKRTIIVGIGCRKDISSEAILSAVHEALEKVKADIEDVRILASPEVKRQEKGLIEAARVLDRPLLFIPHKDINRCVVCEASEVAQNHLGLRAAAEPCALLSGRRTQLILPKMKKDGVTIALARESCSWLEWAQEAENTEPTPP